MSSLLLCAYHSPFQHLENSDSTLDGIMRHVRLDNNLPRSGFGLPMILNNLNWIIPAGSDWITRSVRSGVCPSLVNCDFYKDLVYRYFNRNSTLHASFT